MASLPSPFCIGRNSKKPRIPRWGFFICPYSEGLTGRERAICVVLKAPKLEAAA
jgi:hypothetical protein